MPDDMDRVQGINEQHQADALDAHFRRRTTLPAAVFQPTDCEDCGEQIPEARLAAVPGCIRCVICQTAFERGGRK